MNDEKIYIKQLPKELGISRTKLYELFKQFGLQTKKDGRKGYINPSEYSYLREKIKLSESSEQFRTSGQFEERERSDPLKILVEQFEKEKAELKQELKQEREEKNKISYLLGQAQSEHESTKKELLRLQQISEEPEPPRKSWWQVWKK